MLAALSAIDEKKESGCSFMSFQYFFFYIFFHVKFSFIKYWLMRVCVRSILLLHSSFSAHTIHYFGWEQKKISDSCSEKCKLHSAAATLCWLFHSAIHFSTPILELNYLPTTFFCSFIFYLLTTAKEREATAREGGDAE